MTERFEATTTVRRPRVVLMWITVGLMVVMFALSAFLWGYVGWQWQPLMQLPWWVIGPIIAAIQRRPKIETLRVEATADGVRFGDKLVPRAKLKSALLRREGEKTFMLLRGAGSWGASVDVEVKDDDEADRLCSALALDAKSTVAEFAMFGGGAARATARTVLIALAVLIAGIAGATFAIAGHHMLAPIVIVMALLFGVLIAIPAAIYSKQTKLRVGADGIVVKRGFAKREFVSHDDIDKVAAEGADVVVTRKSGQRMTFAVAREAAKKKPQVEEVRRQAESIAWRIEKARHAYEALAGSAPQAALALDRGDKTVREWIEQLRRVGQGANATFRDVGLTREQLMRVVESTTAAAKERLAAAVALREGLTEEEKPRIRVAADRCVEPAMRERMVRVAFAPEEELVAALDEDVSDAAVARR